MAAGRKPKPTRLKLISGNPGGRPLPKDEPQPDVKRKVPRCPPHLTSEAKRHWPKFAKQLHKVGLLTEADELALEALCEAYARWRDALGQIEEFGPLVKTPNGYPTQSPYLQIANKAFDQFQKMLVEFGLTPSSRTRIRGEK